MISMCSLHAYLMIEHESKDLALELVAEFGYYNCKDIEE